MPALAAQILVGFVVGILIGLTGVGCGVLLLPVLIYGLRIPAIVAVGSDALFNFFTKIPAGLLHLKKDTVRRKVVIALACGSVPGSIAGVKLLMHIRHLYGDGVNSFIKTTVGILLIVIPTLLLLLFYSFPPKVNVGTDIVHAVVLTGVTGLLHFRLGNVDSGLVLSLLIGSIPGGLLGSHLATRVPMLWLRRLLCALLLITGARMLWA